MAKDRNERYYGIQSIFDYLTSPLQSLLPPQGVLPRSPLGGVELPQTIKLIAGGVFLHKISFKATKFYKKLLYGHLFDSSSSEDEDDPAISSVIPLKFTDDYQVITQYSERSPGGDHSSYVNEETRTPSNMGNDKPIKEIVVPGGDNHSGATIPAWTGLDSTTAEEWKQHTQV